MYNKKMKKKKVAIVSLTACEGCQIALLDLGEKFFNFLGKVELVDFHLLEEKPFPKGKIDIVFVEGNPITDEDLKILKKVREQAKILVVIGNCAALGGIPEMKNYQGKEKTIRHIYKNLENIANPDIKEVDNFVKVDFTIPGCPITNNEFLKYAKILITGKIPKIPVKPVCSECPYWGKETCYLRRKEPCLGPIIYAGCKAVCPKNELPCYGCRSFLPNLKPKGFLKTLEKMKNKEEIESDLEIFGLRDMLKDY
jgi:sulfhydrogenase subunit delta